MAGYGTDEGFTAWLAANGYTLPVGAAASAILRQRGSSYIDGRYGKLFAGAPTGGVTQDPFYPATGATYYGSPIADDLIPIPVVEASYFAAYAEAISPGSLSVTIRTGRLTKREKVEGAVEREFFAPGDDMLAAMTPVMSAVEGLLTPFFAPDRTDEPWIAVL